MIDSLKEVNRLLLAVKQSGIGDKGAPESTATKYCSDTVIECRFPNHKATVDFCVLTGLVKRKGNRLLINEMGKRLLSLNAGKSYHLSEKQKEFIVINCLLSGNLSTEVRKILQGFVPAYKSKTFKWSKVDDPPLSGDTRLIHIMLESGLLFMERDLLVMDSKYLNLMGKLTKPQHVITDEELKTRLDEQEKVGKIAEELILDYERKRLRAIGCKAEAECIQKISGLNVSAGYDIRSFDGESPDFVHNRFIEVKGSKSMEITFFWTQNEIETAKRMASKYWIYFLGNINPDTKSTTSKPVTLMDPAHTILGNRAFEVECVHYLVRKLEAVSPAKHKRSKTAKN